MEEELGEEVMNVVAEYKGMPGVWKCKKLHDLHKMPPNSCFARMHL